MIEKVCVVGLGYIGLPTAAVLAARKISVIGVDINPEVVATINRGSIHIVEPDLDMLVHAAVSAGYLQAATKAQTADAFIIAVPTPLDVNNKPDLSFVKQAVSVIAEYLQPGNLVILESTSPVGSTEKVAAWLQDLRPDLRLPPANDANVNIAYCPERVLPGKVLYELVNNSRVIGGLTTACSKRALELYQNFVLAKCYLTSARCAEMCKLTENSFRDVNIAFANELSMVCDELNIDVWELIGLANHHPRVNILQPGPGVGGHCIAVDPWFIVDSAPNSAQLIKTARQVNLAKEAWVIEKFLHMRLDIEQKNSKRLEDITVACLGITFKPNIDDLRESPALTIAEQIANIHPGPLLIVEPNITKLPHPLSKLASLSDLDSACLEADIVLLLVDHQEFVLRPQQFWQPLNLFDVRGLEHR